MKLLDLTDIWVYTEHIFAIANGTVTKIDNILGCKTNINKYLKIEIIKNEIFYND